MNKKQITALLVSSQLLVSILFVGCEKEEETTTDNRTIQQIQAEQGIPVTTAPIVQGSIRHIEKSNGTLEGQQQTILANGVGGTLASVNVAVGQNVRNGTRVASMSLLGGSPVVVAQSNFDYAEQAYERAVRLHEEGAVSQEQVEGAKAQYEGARIQLGQARVAVNIDAKFSGTVLEIYKTAGTQIGAETPIVKVANLDRMRVEMQVSDQAINHYEVGQPAFIIMDSDTLWGNIERTALSANEMSHSFKVSAIFDNPNGILKPGMFRNVYTVVNQKDMILKVPFEIVTFEGEKTFLFVVNGETVKKQEVTLGIRDENHIEVVSGVTESDILVVSGMNKLSDGTKINIVNQ